MPVVLGLCIAEGDHTGLFMPVVLGLCIAHTVARIVRVEPRLSSLECRCCEDIALRVG